MEAFTIVTQPYFGQYSHRMGYIICLFSLTFLIAGNLILGMLLVLGAVLCFKTNYKLKFDPANKRVFDFIDIVGYKKGEYLEIEDFSKVFITNTKYTRYTEFGDKSGLKDVVYNLYLATSNRKFFLKESESKRKVIDLAEELCLKLEIPLEDYT